MITPNRILPLIKLRKGKRPPAEALLIISAVFLGIITGLATVFFIRFIGEIDRLAQAAYAWGGMASLLVFMAGAGLVIGLLIDRFAPEAKGHGVPEVMEAIALHGGRIRPPVALVKVLASSITIGAGGSAGREGPIVQVGATLGSTFGQILHLSEERIRTLVACGAAAGIAATFNAPIAGAIFALEVILDRFTIRHFSMVVLSAVSASITSRIFLGNQPAFVVPAYPLHHLAELPLYVVLGVVSALAAVAFIRLLYGFEGFFDGWRIPLPFKTSLGMLATGLLAFLLPNRDVLGPGLDFIGEVIAQDFEVTLRFMVILVFLKLVVTSFTLGSGNSGGVFAPGLFMGAVLGGIVGTIGKFAWPELVIDPGAYAIVGMAAVFSGAARAPITAVLIVFEMSGDYKLILPLMLATVLSTVLAEYLVAESIYTLKLKLRGIDLSRGRDEDLLQSITVEEVISSDPETILFTSTLEELDAKLRLTHRHGFPVVDQAESLVGIVTISDLARALGQNLAGDTPVKAICTPREKLSVCHPSESIGDALKRMAAIGVGHLPVVIEGTPSRLLGVIRRADILDAYRIAINRRALIQHRTKQLQIKNLDGTQFVDYRIEEGDLAAGQPVRLLAANLPKACVLVSIRRGGGLIIPHGDTILQPGDRITAFVANTSKNQVDELFVKRP